MLRFGFRPVLAVRGGYSRLGAAGAGGLLPVARWAAFLPCKRPDFAAGRFQDVFSNPAEWQHPFLQWRRGLLLGRGALGPARPACGHLEGGAPAHRAYKERRGQGGAALVYGTDDAGAARAAAGRLSGHTAPRPDD